MDILLDSGPKKFLKISTGTRTATKNAPTASIEDMWSEVNFRPPFSFGQFSDYLNHKKLY